MKKHLDGVFTVEASFIIVWITLLVVAIIRLDFSLHDALLSDAGLVLAGLRYREAEYFYYDPVELSFNYQALAAAPVYLTDSDYLDRALQIIKQHTQSYYEEHRLSFDSALSETSISSVFSVKSNANLIQAGGRAAEFISEVWNQ